MNPTPRSNAAEGTVNQWTPGPWRVEASWNEPGRLTVSALTSPTSNERGLICSTDGTPFREREPANARLIALAPTMAQTIQDVLDWTEGDIEAHLELDADADLGHLNHRATQLRAILARINGEGGGV